MEKKKIRVVEIGPRDGFQSVKTFIPTEIKKKIIEGIIGAGVGKIQITSFVSPKAIPQMTDAQEITRWVFENYSDTGIDFFALVPNLYGAKAAVQAGLTHLTPVMSLSESHNMNNVRKTCAQSIEEFRTIRETFPDILLEPDIATSFGCPFEGETVSVDPLIELIGKITDLGIRDFTLCDTVGLAYPTLVRKVFGAVRESFPECRFSVHIHDTRNMGIINSMTALEYGAVSVQTAVGGLGGCPFAPGATGNTSTEDLVYMLNKCGYETGINTDKYIRLAKFVKENVEGNFSGHQIMISEHPCVIRQE